MFNIRHYRTRQDVQQEQECPEYYESPIYNHIYDSTPHKAPFIFEMDGYNFVPSSERIDCGKSNVLETMFLEGYSSKDYTHNTYSLAAMDIDIAPIKDIAREPFHPDTMWKWGEVHKFHIGIYKPTIWNRQIWYQNSKYAAIHFLHLSKDDPTKLAITENKMAGKLNRQIRMKPGRYLTRFFKDIFTEQERKQLINEFNAAHCEPQNVHFTSNSDDVEFVYENGPCSCMVMDRDDKYIRSTTHPCRVYATDDVCVAYTKKSPNRIQQRTVINKIRKEYTVIYGEGSLRTQLEAMGYEEGSIEGCRILYLEDEDTGHPLMPYIDGDLEAVYEGTKYFKLLTRGEFNTTQTNGFLEETVTCSCCDENIAMNNTYTVGYGGQSRVCSECFNDYYIECTDGYYYHEDDCIQVYRDIDRYFYDHYYKNGDMDTVASYDTVTGEYYTNNVYEALIEKREKQEDSKQEDSLDSVYDVVKIRIG